MYEGGKEKGERKVEGEGRRELGRKEQTKERGGKEGGKKKGERKEGRDRNEMNERSLVRYTKQ
jgi:hypothetical protein